MTLRDDMLNESTEFKTIPMPIALYCAFSHCQTLIKKGTPVKKFDGATYVHVSCPDSPLREFAAHKQPDTGMRLS